MIERINPGDLVWVKRGCCEPDQRLGQIHTVACVSTEPAQCGRCGRFYDGPNAVFLEDDERWARPLPWLKKIKPLPELQTYRRTEEMEARR